jgi:predicted ArsR family transcriptional regulator
MSAREFLAVLGGKYSLDILEATGEPRSAQELSAELDIPTATCYRRLEAMTELGLLEVREGRSEHGRQTDLFRRRIQEINFTVGESTAVTAEERSTASRTVDRLWSRLRQGASA